MAFGSGANPLDEYTVIALLGGVESLCDHLGDLTDQMLERARSMREDEGAR